jgi:hypothetical protein
MHALFCADRRAPCISLLINGEIDNNSTVAMELNQPVGGATTWLAKALLYAGRASPRAT